jgi:hypothetical protein
MGKPRRATSDGARPRVLVAADSRAEQGLGVEPDARSVNGREAWVHGDVDPASREGKALEGRHRRESAHRAAGTRSRGVATR